MGKGAAMKRRFLGLRRLRAVTEWLEGHRIRSFVMISTEGRRLHRPHGEARPERREAAPREEGPQGC
jgi:hypothetical protein